MAQSGVLLIADVSGYTMFLTQSELEHAQDILENLFKLLLDNIKPPLLVSKLEGDAIFCYAPDGSFLQGQTVVEIVEQLYHVFSSNRERIRRNTTCTCKACSNIPTLDLKFAVHHGEYVISSMGKQDELHSADVIVVHRLLKNSVDEVFNTKGYAFFTQAAATALKLEEMCKAMEPHTEEYEHVGVIPGYVHDLKKAMERQRDKRRIVVPHETAWRTIEEVFPVPPALLWDYLNEPNRQAQWMGVHGIRLTGLQAGRKAQGSTMHCAHGKSEGQFMVEDWQPFDYSTYSMKMGPATYLYSLHLIPEGNNTRLKWCFEAKATNALMVAGAKVFFLKMVEGDFRKCVAGLKKMVDEDVNGGKVVVSRGGALLSPA